MHSCTLSPHPPISLILYRIIRILMHTYLTSIHQTPIQIIPIPHLPQSIQRPCPSISIKSMLAFGRYDKRSTASRRLCPSNPLQVMPSPSLANRPLCKTRCALGQQTRAATRIRRWCAYSKATLSSLINALSPALRPPCVVSMPAESPTKPWCLPNRVHPTDLASAQIHADACKPNKRCEA